MKKTYLITGGAGFIGSHLSERLIADGHRVIALDDLSTGRAENVTHLLRESRFELVRGNASEPGVIAPLVARCDAVFHLAAALGVKLVVNDPMRTIRTGICSTEAVLDAACRRGTPVLISSSSEVYGKSTRVPFTESDDVVMGPTQANRWCYAYTKGITEFLALACHRDRGLPVVVVRLFNTVGPRQVGQHGMVLPRFIDAALANRPLCVYGGGSQTRCFCHVRDTVQGLIKLMETPAAAGQVVNLGNDHEVSIRALAERVIALTGSSSTIEDVSFERAFGPSFEDMQRRVPSLAKLESLIGFRPRTDLDEIIRSMVHFARGTDTPELLEIAVRPDAAAWVDHRRAGTLTD